MKTGIEVLKIPESFWVTSVRFRPCAAVVLCDFQPAADVPHVFQSAVWFVGKFACGPYVGKTQEVSSRFGGHCDLTVTCLQHDVTDGSAS